MAKSKRNKNKQNVNTKAKARKRRIAIARFKLFATLLVIGGAVFGIYKFTTSIERPPLSIDVSGYAQQTTNNSGAVVTDTDGNIITLEDDAFEEEAILVFQPSLKESYPIEMDIFSPRAVVFDATANEMLFAKNADEKCFPASTTKILSAAVILDSVPSDFEFVAGNEIELVNPGSSLANINFGARLDTEMIIDGMMLPSGNDASYIAAANVGRYLAGDDTISASDAVSRFVDEMNKTVKAIGADNTHFANPDGFHNDNHYTTVLDMLKITLYSKEIPMLSASAKKTNRYCTFLSGESVSWENSNKLLHEYSDCYYMYATGLKTGMTDEAGYCVIATAERFGHEIVCIVFGSSASDVRWNDTIALMDKSFAYIKENYELE